MAIAACTSSLKLLDGFQLNLMAGPTLKVVGEISLWIILVCVCRKLVEVN